MRLLDEALGALGSLQTADLFDISLTEARHAPRQPSPLPLALTLPLTLTLTPNPYPYPYPYPYP